MSGDADAEHKDGPAHEVATVSDIVHRDHSVRWVGRYCILAELGRGGMSHVYLAVSRSMSGVSKLVVLKAVLPQLALEPESLAMFLDEARLAAQLNHPNVVQTYEVGLEGNRHVIVMEHLEGQTLGHVLANARRSREPVPVALMIRILIDTLAGLHYAHELCAYDGTALHLVHRDVSPQNIFITYDGQVKVLDFGIAKATSSSTQTSTGIVKGKLPYMAPEQMVADAIARRADIYSMGCLLWDIAAGRKLWKDTLHVQIMRHVINGQVPSPKSVNPACGEELNRIVMRALSLEPADRYPTALAFQEELERYCEELAGTVRQKDVGAFVSALFRERRAEMKSVIERQIVLAMAQRDRPVSVLREGQPATGGAGVEGPTVMDRLSRAPEVDVVSGTRQTGFATVRRSHFRWLVLAGLSGLLALVVLLVWGRGASPEPTTPMDVARPVAATATVLLRAFPPEATVFLNGERLPTNPASKLLPRESQLHTLRAEAAGHVPQTLQFSVTHNESIELTLEKMPEPTQATGSTGPSDSASARPASPKTNRTPQARSCTQPFFVDHDGIKKMRRECL